MEKTGELFLEWEPSIAPSNERQGRMAKLVVVALSIRLHQFIRVGPQPPERVIGGSKVGKNIRLQFAGLRHVEHCQACAVSALGAVQGVESEDRLGGSEAICQRRL